MTHATRFSVHDGDTGGLTALPLRGTILAALLCFAGCAHDRAVRDMSPKPLPPLPALSADTGTATPRVSGPVGTLAQHPQVTVSTVPSRLATLGPAATGAGPGNVNLNFEDADIREIAAQILGSDLRVNYAIDPSVHGTATLRTVTPLTNAQLLPVLQALLAQNGATLSQQNGVYRVLPFAAANGGLATPGTAGGTMVALRYAAAEDMARALATYAQAGARIIAVPAANAVVITGEPAQRDALVELVQSFDVDTLAGQSYALFPVSTGDAADLADALKSAFHAAQGQPLANAIRVIPLTRVNAVLVAASAPQYIEEARRAFAVVERGRRQTMRSWHVYYLQNGTSNDVAYTLQQAFTPDNVTAQPSAHASGQAGGNSASASGISSISAMGNSSSGGSGGSSGLGGLGGGGGSGSSLGGLGGGASSTGLGGTASGGHAATSAGGATGANPLLGGVSNSAGGGNNPANAMRIIPNPDNNAILIYATGEEEDTVESMLHKIDILPLQVRIDAIIAEVTLNDNLAYGTQFYFKHHSLGGGLVQDAANAVTGSGGFYSATAGAIPGYSTPNGTFSIGGASGDLVLQALQDITTVKVLSAPDLLVLDNETAQLQVGNEVPVQNGTLTTTGSSTGVLSSTSYVTTGVITQVTPRVNSGGLVTLDIQQEVSAVVSASSVSGESGTTAAQSPTISDRAVKSRVVIQDGQTVGLAGLITDNATKDNSGLPFLKDIPLLGAAFSTQNNTRTRTELLILLTPHVLHDQRDARSLTQDLREALPRAAALPYESNQSKPTGSDDPQSHLGRSLGMTP
jgi:general secretion pathway protein D